MNRLIEFAQQHHSRITIDQSSRRDIVLYSIEFPIGNVITKTLDEWSVWLDLRETVIQLRTLQ